MSDTYTEQLKKRLDEYYNKLRFLEKENRSLKTSLDVLQNSGKIMQNLAILVMKSRNDDTSTISSVIEEAKNML